MLHHLPSLAALLIIGVIFAVVADQLTIGPSWLFLGPIIAFVIMIGASLILGRFKLRRWLGFLILGMITLGTAASTTALVAGLVGTSLRLSDIPHEAALGLLRDAALIWLVNTLTFALWYWEIDAGGPSQRIHHGYASKDFVFPQLAGATADASQWCPHFIDYLFLAFNTSTAFSPTDTLVLSLRAKLLMMIQSLISLIVLAVIAARGINTL
jgi:hypothetical protein